MTGTNDLDRLMLSMTYENLLYREMMVSEMITRDVGQRNGHQKQRPTEYVGQRPTTLSHLPIN